MKTRLFCVLALVAAAAHGQLVISDSFDVTGGSSAATGFGTDGVNTEIATRLTGQAATDETLTYVHSRTDKPDTAFSIANDRFQIDPAIDPGVFEFSADGSTAFDFGSYLRGKVYEILVTMDNDSVGVSNRRFTFGIGTSSAQFVQDIPLAVQLQADAGQTGAQLFKRVDGASNPDGGDLNVAIGPALAYGDPVTVRILVTDVDATAVRQSSYEIYINGGATPIDSGTFGFPKEPRHLLFDIAPDAGPVTYDDFSLTVTGDAPEPVIGDRYIYFVGTDGEVRGFTGMDVGNVPVTGAASFTAGVFEAYHPDYGGFQGFTTDPTTGIVYGVNTLGDVVQWPTLADWMADTNASAPENPGDPGYEAYGTRGGQGSVHGISYDPNTGGFYVVYEGTDPNIDGDIGEYPTASDFINNTNATVTVSVYGGNILNFYYWGEDTPTNRAAPNDIPGANYLHATGGGQLEGFQTLAQYVDPANRTFEKSGFCVNCTGAFALPFPVEPDLMFRITGVTRNGSDEVTDATLEFSPQSGASYSIQASQDLTTPFTVVPGFDNVTTSPVVVPVPAGFESRGFLRLMTNP